MKKLFKFVCFIVFLATFFSCSKEYEVPQDLVVHDFIWKGLNAYYLHQDQIADLSDRRFNSDQELNNFLKTFETTDDLFSSLLQLGDTKSKLVSDFSTLQNANSLRSESGFQFGIIVEPGKAEDVIGFVYYVLPNSDAAIKNLTRGEFFNQVNGVQLTKGNYQDLLLNTTTDYTLSMVNFDGVTVTANGKFITLKSEVYNSPPIFLEKTITTGTNNIGYLVYNNNFSTSYIDDLNTSFLNFKNQSINKLILDLRYNIGGGSYAKNISKLAAMITGQFAEEVLIKEKWNTKAQTWFELNQPDSLITNFPTKLNATTVINSLNTTDLYIILNGNNFTGSSAIELLINSLKPYINVHVIGNSTIGNNTGSITLYNSPDYDFALKNKTHTFALQPIVLSFLNKDDQTYENGITPTVNLCQNENILDLGVLGETSDPIFNRVLNYINTGNLGTSNCNSDNFEFVHHTISNQRETDNGVFIQQDLPNTN